MYNWDMDEVVSVRVNNKDIDFIEKLIKEGKFKNRSSAFRKLVEIGIEEIRKEFLFDNIINLDDIEFTEEEAFKIGRILFDKPVAEIVSESRE